MTDPEICLCDWYQRLKENPPDPLEEIRQQHESWLADLEGLAVEAIAINNWDAFYAHVVNFQNEHELHGETGIAIGDLEASTKTLARSGADLLPPTEQTSVTGDKSIMPDEFFYIELAEACDGDKSKILAAAAEALTHVNGHSEAAIVREILSQSNHENAQFDALFDVAFGRGQQ